jgi:replicative superfamily II helicase
MKTIEETIISHTKDHSNHKIRFVAVSATVSNIEDVAEWIGSSSNVKCYKLRLVHHSTN